LNFLFKAVKHHNLQVRETAHTLQMKILVLMLKSLNLAIENKV